MRRDPAARTAVYAAAGLVAGIVFFSLGQGKVAAYILPLAPLAALVVTWELGREIAAPRTHAVGPTALAATVSSSAALLGLAGIYRLDGPPRLVAAIGAGCFAVGALVALGGAVARRPRWVYGSAAGATAAVLLSAVIVLFPELGRTRSAASLIAAVPELKSARPVVTVEVRVPSLIFYLDRPTQVLELHELEARLADGDRPLLVFADVDLPAVPEDVASGLSEVGRHGKYMVFEKESDRE